MGKHLTRWFTYGIVFALIPLAASLLIHFFAGKLKFDVISRSPELLFFALMVNATALGDLSEIGTPRVHDLSLTIIKSGLFVGVIMSAILYGAFLFATTADAVDADFAMRVFGVSVVLAVLSFGVSTIGEIFLGLVEKNA